MSQIEKYSALNAKLRGKLSSLLTEDTLNKLKNSQSVERFMQIIAESRLKKAVTKYYDSGDIQRFEQQMIEDQIDVYHTLKSYCTKGISRVLLALLEKIEIDNIKNCIRLWYARNIQGRSLLERATYLYDKEIVFKIDWQLIINADSFSSLKKALSHSPYHVVVDNYDEKKLSNSLFDLECSFDQLYYKRIIESKKFLSKTDQDIYNKILMNDINFKNLINVIRYGWYYKLDKDEVEKVLIPNFRVYRSNEVKKFLESSDKDVLSLIREFLPEIESSVDKALSMEDIDINNQRSSEVARAQIMAIEALLNERRSKIYRSMLTSEPFTIALLLSYLLSYRQQDMYVVSLLQSVYYNIKRSN